MNCSTHISVAPAHHRLVPLYRSSLWFWTWRLPLEINTENMKYCLKKQILKRYHGCCDLPEPKPRPFLFLAFSFSLWMLSEESYSNKLKPVHAAGGFHCASAVCSNSMLTFKYRNSITQWYDLIFLLNYGHNNSKMLVKTASISCRWKHLAVGLN